MVRVKEKTPLMRHAHLQVPIYNKDIAREIYVDQGMAPLLQALWAVGFRTEWSCQGGREPGTQSIAGGTARRSSFPDHVLSDAHIVFATWEDAERFLRQTVTKLEKPWYLTNMNVMVPLGKGAPLRGNVSWAYTLTDDITALWQKELTRV